MDVQLVPVVRPGAELERAHLLVEGEVERVEGAGASEDGLRHPQQAAVGVHHDQSITLLPETVVSAGIKKGMCCLLVIFNVQDKWGRL